MQVNQSSTLAEMTSDMRHKVVICMVQLIKESYVFPEIAEKVGQSILGNLQNKEYDEINDPLEFSQIITSELQEISNDKHLGLKFHINPIGESEESKKKAAENRKRLLSLHNYGFDKVERLPGNIGYHKTLKFFETELAGDIAVASLNFMENTSAIIFDLRDNTGGHSSMVALIISYLLEGRVHLNNFHWRKDNVLEQLWTNSYIQGASLKDKDVYILTSHRTFSGAEDFTYTLKNLKRATVIGERTSGGAHPGGFQRINEYFSVNIPIGRAINPITNENWEAIGVTPHIEVSEEHALIVAQYLCIQRLLENNPDKDIMGKTWQSLIEKLELDLSEYGIEKAELTI